MIGVSFQPGAGGGSWTTPQSSGQRSNPVQEAIKVLSLRLPKVVGAQSVSPSSLLTSGGSNGGRVDSVVNAVLSRMFPTGQAGQMPNAPSFGTAPSVDAPQDAPSFSGSGYTPYQSRTEQPMPTPFTQTPRVIVGPGLPTWFGGNMGDFSVGSDGRPTGGAPPAAIDTTPSSFTPPAPDPPKRSPFPDVPYGGGYDPPDPTPLF